MPEGFKIGKAEAHPNRHHFSHGREVGKGAFFSGRVTAGLVGEVEAAGSFRFVPAGQVHRFEDFSADFVVWVVFYGPEGGEAEA